MLLSDSLLLSVVLILFGLDLRKVVSGLSLKSGVCVHLAANSALGWVHRVHIKLGLLAFLHVLVITLTPVRHDVVIEVVVHDVVLVLSYDIHGVENIQRVINSALDVLEVDFLTRL